MTPMGEREIIGSHTISIVVGIFLSESFTLYRVLTADV